MTIWKDENKDDESSQSIKKTATMSEKVCQFLISVACSLQANYTDRAAAAC
jgi:hypothetical protein